MGFFSNILEKLGLKKDKPASAEVTASGKPAPSAGISTPKEASSSIDEIAAARIERARSGAAAGAAAAAAGPAAISEVDVVSQLEKLSAGSELNWKVSIVDLLKVLGIDSSREARNELAKELGCPAELMSDSAKMNVWLHKEVLKQIAKNGGNIPASMLD